MTFKILNHFISLRLSIVVRFFFLHSLQVNALFMVKYKKTCCVVTVTPTLAATLPFVLDLLQCVKKKAILQFDIIFKEL